MQIVPPTDVARQSDLESFKSDIREATSKSVMTGAPNTSQATGLWQHPPQVLRNSDYDQSQHHMIIYDSQVMLFPFHVLEDVTFDALSLNSYGHTENSSYNDRRVLIYSHSNGEPQLEAPFFNQTFPAVSVSSEGEKVLSIAPTTLTKGKYWLGLSGWYLYGVPLPYRNTSYSNLVKEFGVSKPCLQSRGSYIIYQTWNLLEQGFFNAAAYDHSFYPQFAWRVAP